MRKRCSFILLCMFILSGCSIVNIQERESESSNYEISKEDPSKITEKDQTETMEEDSSEETQPETASRDIAPNAKIVSKDFYNENTWNKKVVNLEMADLTHDGVDDYVVTMIYVSSSVTSEDPADMLVNAGVGYIQVYDGSNTNGLDELGTLIWEKEFADAHPGNAQINLVSRDGKDYILSTGIDSQMGTYYFHYEVLSLDEKGNEYIIEENTLTYDTYDTTVHEQHPLNEEQKQEIKAFKQEIEAWFEGAVLLAATNVSLEKALVSTPMLKYVPEDFYETVLEQYIQ